MTFYDEVVHSERGEFMGDGIPRTAGGIPYNPLAGHRQFADDEFWNSRASLQEIKENALATYVSPYVVLAGVLARVGVATPPHIVLPKIIGGGYGSLNFGVVTLGEPGSGKDAAFDTACELVPDVREAAICGAATGQSISALFGRREGDEGKRRTVCNNLRAILRYSEASNFRSLSSSKESNLKPVLLSLFSGQQIGEYTKNQELAIIIPAHAYRAIPFFSAQPSMMSLFEAGVHEGFQQRFLYVSAYDERLATLDPAAAPVRPVPGVFPYDTAALPSDWSKETMDCLYQCGGYGKTDDATEPLAMNFPDIVRREAVAERIRANQERDVDPRLAHGTYMRMKLAALLCLLEYPRRQSLEVNEKDWELAGFLQRESRRCYEENLEKYNKLKRQRRADGKEEDELAREEVDKRGQQDAERRIIEILRSSMSPSGMSRRELFQQLSKRQRNYLDDALGNLVASGRIKTGKGRQGGDWYMLN